MENGNSMGTATQHSAASIEMPGGYLKIDPLPNFRYRVTAVPESPQVFIARESCETDFSLALIQAVVAESTIGWICDLIARHCEPDYVSQALKHQLDAFRPPGEMRGRFSILAAGPAPPPFSWLACFRTPR